jgi:LysR family transcriptional regulator, hydrogen peroxide-inducible genes activator
VPDSHPLAGRKTIRLEEVAKENRFLLLKEGHCFRDSTIEACRKSRIVPNVVFESGQFATILGMVSAGMGISAVPSMAVQTAKGCRFIRIGNNDATRSLGATMLSRHFQTRAQKVFLQHLLKTAAVIGNNGGRFGPFR